MQTSEMRSQVPQVIQHADEEKEEADERVRMRRRREKSVVKMTHKINSGFLECRESKKKKNMRAPTKRNHRHENAPAAATAIATIIAHTHAHTHTETEFHSTLLFLCVPFYVRYTGMWMWKCGVGKWHLSIEV